MVSWFAERNFKRRQIKIKVNRHTFVKMRINSYKLRTGNLIQNKLLELV